MLHFFLGILHDTLVELYPPLNTADALQASTEHQPLPKKLNLRYASKLSSPGVSNVGHDSSLDRQIQRFFRGIMVKCLLMALLTP